MPTRTLVDTDSVQTVSNKNITGATITASTITTTGSTLTSPTLVTPTVTGALTIAGQLVFPAIENASAGANTLDDYEEGTWVPSLGGTATYTVQSGTYIKIGRLVYIQGELTVNTLGTGSTTTISGLPFTTPFAAGNDGFIGISASASLAATPVSLSFFVSNNSTTLLATGRLAAAASSAPVTIFGNSAGVVFAGCYHV